jgi:hypothetical protein
MNPESMVAAGTTLFIDLGASGLYKYSSGTLSKVTKTSAYNNNLITRLESTTFADPDEYGNIYYHLLNENWNNQGYGRPDIAKRMTPDEDSGAMAYSFTYSSTYSNPDPIKEKAYANSEMTQLVYINTTYNNSATPRNESETYLDNSIRTDQAYVLATYTKYDDDNGRGQERILASGDDADFVYLRLMNDDWQRAGYEIAATPWEGGKSFIYSYYGDSTNVHFINFYSDQFWTTFVKAWEFAPEGGDPTEYTDSEKAPVAGDQSDWDQRAAVKSKVQAYGTTAEGGFTFTSALAGENPNSFVPQSGGV